MQQIAMRQTVLDYPAGLPGLLRFSEAEFTAHIKFLAAAKLYENGKLSSGKAAQMAGMERVNFLYQLGQCGFHTINLDKEEALVEVEAAHRLIPSSQQVIQIVLGDAGEWAQNLISKRSAPPSNSPPGGKTKPPPRWGGLRGGIFRSIRSANLLTAPYHKVSGPPPERLP